MLEWASNAASEINSLHSKTVGIISIGTARLLLFLSSAGCLGNAVVQCQQMTGDASKVLALGMFGGSSPSELAQVVAAWPVLSLE